MDDIKFEDVKFLHGKLLRNVFEEMCVFGFKTDFLLNWRRRILLEKVFKIKG